MSELADEKPIFAVPDSTMCDPQKISQTKDELKSKGVEYLLSSYVDIHGVPKSKVNPIDAIDKMANGSELFTVGAMEGMGLVGPQEDECAAVPDLSTATVCPWDERFAFFFGDLYYHGTPYPNDSRQILKRQLARAEAMGFTFNLGVEPEFYVFREDSETNELSTLSRHSYKGLCPAYDVYQAQNSMEFLDPMAKAMNQLGWGVFSFDQEGGHSQFEFDSDYSDALTTSDRLIFLRLMAKQIAGSMGCIATFMAKPFANDFRSGCHFNMSLASKETGENLFAPDSSKTSLAEKYNMPFSNLAYHFMAGILKHANAITAVTSPTYNSYQGFLAQGDMPDVSWAPVLVAYGANNRSAMLRLPPNRYCVENRAPDMTVNPYLAAALQLAAGLDGIEEALDPGEPLNENLYLLSKKEIRESGVSFLPGTLLHAIEAFEEDSFVDSVFGEMKDIFIQQKTMEWEKEFYTVHDRQRDQRMTFI